MSNGDAPASTVADSTRRMAAESIVRLAGEAVAARWSDSVQAALVHLLRASTDANAKLVLESHVDGSGRVDVSVYDWVDGGFPREFHAGEARLTVKSVLGTEFDLTDDAPVTMGTFASLEAGSDVLFEGLPMPAFIGVSHRQPGQLRCIIQLAPKHIDAARQLTEPFASLPWEACEAWLTQAARVRLAIDIDETGQIVPVHAGLELIDTWGAAQRHEAIDGLGISAKHCKRAESLWQGLPRVHEVRVAPAELPSTRLVLGKAQARHSHVKVTAGPDLPLELKTYTASEWVPAGVTHESADTMTGISPQGATESVTPHPLV